MRASCLQLSEYRRCGAAAAVATAPAGAVSAGAKQPERRSERLSQLVRGLEATRFAAGTRRAGTPALLGRHNGATRCSCVALAGSARRPRRELGAAFQQMPPRADARAGPARRHRRSPSRALRLAWLPPAVTTTTTSGPMVARRARLPRSAQQHGATAALPRCCASACEACERGTRLDALTPSSPASFSAALPSGAARRLARQRETSRHASDSGACAACAGLCAAPSSPQGGKSEMQRGFARAGAAANRTPSTAG